MKDRFVRLGLRQSPGGSAEPAWPKPFASPEPELDGVADELRQLYQMYSDHGDVPDELADLAKRAADAYESVTPEGSPDPAPDRQRGRDPRH